jgi:hypothetical protein
MELSSLTGDIGRGVLSLPSHAGDGVTEVMLVVVRCHCRVMLAMSLPSLAGDGAIEATLLMV